MEHILYKYTCYSNTVLKIELTSLVLMTKLSGRLFALQRWRAKYFGYFVILCSISAWVYVSHLSGKGEHIKNDDFSSTLKVFHRSFYVSNCNEMKYSEYFFRTLHLAIIVSYLFEAKISI